MKTTSELITELKQERYDLNIKLGKLSQELSSPEKYGLSEQQLYYMNEQANAMQRYSNILGARIEDFNSIEYK